MRILSLELKNIRSYRQAQVEFPDGITLLSGDIGAGKSTMLLAIEFALFGLSRGELVGSALLRHGASDGTVTLRFTIHGQEYSIRRTLKRTAATIVQDNGVIETNGNRELLTPSELRARVFELLGYPLQFLGKQRNLLYRFTIYTPQEEMKSILAQGSEERLETVRRIFGVDAYRIARDNAQHAAKALRERESVHEALLPRITQDQERLQQKLLRETELQQQRARMVQERELLARQLQQAEAALAGIEKEQLALQHEQQLAAMQERTRKLAESEIRALQQQLERKERLLRETNVLIEKLRSTQSLFSSELVDVPDIAALRKQQTDALAELERLKQEEGKMLAIIEQCSHGPAIDAGTTCPTCRQQVSSTHLDELRASLDAQATAAQRKQEKVQARVLEQRNALQRSNGALERRRQVEDIAAQIAVQEKSAKQQHEDLAAMRETLRAKQASLPPPAQKIDVERNAALARQLLEQKARVQRCRQQLSDVEKRFGRIEQEEQELRAAREQLVVLGAERLQHEQQLARTAQVRSWIARQFTPFAATVERHVLMSIHTSFDAVFRQWFSRLIEDDGLSTRIDHEFAPIMLQHGYEADVAHLSGGERTAVSLAYRLALVHTIHVMLPHLGTSGVIMLDEPTDGFSAEQLERVRDVLRELRMGQIILVSHEQQLEGFVDHILRVRKTGDGSVIEVTA